jgi:3-methyladenine DNA glycosylase AlkD
MSKKILLKFRRELKVLANQDTRAWFEAYMKYREHYIGVKLPVVEKLITSTVKDLGQSELEELWPLFMRQRYTEEKLAGMIIYQKKLLSSVNERWKSDLTAIHDLTQEGHISWWNTCDWMCIRVLSRMLSHGDEQNKQRIARAIAGWIKSDNLWLRRMSLVSFVNHAKHGDVLFLGAQKLVLATAAELVRSTERFHQTAVGWVIREVYKGDTSVAEKFISTHIQYFSREGLRYAIEKMPTNKRKKYLTW